MTTQITTTVPETNTKGFVEFEHRQWDWKGDRNTWARYDANTRKLTAQLAGKGNISPTFEAEFRAFCESYGITFRWHGDKQSVTLPIGLDEIDRLYFSGLGILEDE